MVLKVKKSERDLYTPKAWEYMRSRYGENLLTVDTMLLSEIKGIADLIATCEIYDKPLSFDQIDLIRYAQDFIEFKGIATLYRIYLLMYDREGWTEYKNGVKGSDRRTALKMQEQKFNDFLEKEKKRNGKNK